MDSLSISDYEKLLNNINVNTAIEYESKIDLVKGEVKITDKKNITINSNRLLIIKFILTLNLAIRNRLT